MKMKSNITYQGRLVEIDYLIEYYDYMDYLPHYGYWNEKRSGEYYIISGLPDAIYQNLTIGDYIGVETEPNREMIWFSTITKKYKNGNVLVYEA